ALADLVKKGGQIFDRLRDDMDDLPFALQPSLDGDHGRGQDDPPIAFVEALPDDDIGNPAFILEGDEGDIAIARPLADENDSRNRDWRTVPYPVETPRCDRSAPLQFVAQESQGMVAQGQLNRTIILDHLASL